MIKNSVVLVPFPFDDFSQLKVRPALCLTAEIGEYKHVIIAFISSKITNEQLESDLIIKKQSKYWSGTGLSVDSVIRLHKIVTIPKSILKRRLGTINEETRNEVSQKLCHLFDQ